MIDQWLEEGEQNKTEKLEKKKKEEVRLWIRAQTLYFK